MISRRRALAITTGAIAFPSVALPQSTPPYTIGQNYLVLPGFGSGGHGWVSALTAPNGIWNPLPLTANFPQRALISRVWFGAACSQPTQAGPLDILAWIDPGGIAW